jgi:ATP adenylyltransferase
MTGPRPAYDGREEVLHQRGVGVPDELERLWTPHRMAYIRGENKPIDADAGEHCPFCRLPSLDDRSGLIVHRGELSYAVLNLYPYSPGHLLVCPYRHIGDYTETTEAEVLEIAALTKTAMRTVRRVSGAHGFNVGMNQGAVAGAGIAAHLHQHVVPRWGGDQNFMPIIGRTRTLPEVMSDTRDLLADAWQGSGPPSG